MKKNRKIDVSHWSGSFDVRNFGRSNQEEV